MDRTFQQGRERIRDALSSGSEREYAEGTGTRRSPLSERRQDKPAPRDRGGFGRHRWESRPHRQVRPRGFHRLTASTDTPPARPISSEEAEGVMSLRAAHAEIDRSQGILCTPADDDQEMTSCPSTMTVPKFPICLR